MPELTPPLLDEPYRGALEDALGFIFARFEPIGVVASGTIVRGNPAPSSDLDLYVLHRQPWRQRLQRVFRGVPAELFVNPPERVQAHFAAEREDGRPVTAHMLATGVVVYAADPLVDELRARAASELARGPAPSAARLTALRYAAATSFEDALDVDGADPATGAMFLFWAVERCLEYAFLSRNRWQPRRKEWLAELARLDPELAGLASDFYRACRDAERFELAGRIAGRTVGATGFFEWEAEPD
jgi:hypothetical protein